MFNIYKLKKSALKSPTTYKEQINLLRTRNLIIEDEKFAEEILSQISYYRLSGYLLPFKDNQIDCYVSDINFNKLYQIYEFDKKLRNLIMSLIETIEIMLRSKISYYHVHKYGAEGYIEAKNYKNILNYYEIKRYLKNEIKKNKKRLFVKHHIIKYRGHFPFWVVIELFTIGMLSKFYSFISKEDQKFISKNLFNIDRKRLSTWLESISLVRNRCAHHSRLYFYNLTTSPKLPKGLYSKPLNGIFDIIYIIKYLYPNFNDWKTIIVPELEVLINLYSEYIDLLHIGFPENWKELLFLNPID